MIKRILLNPLLKPILRTLFLWSPRSLSTLVYSAFRSSGDPRVAHFDKAFESLGNSSSRGDYLEFGVYRGASFIMASQLAGKYQQESMRFFAFDSFQGLPDSEGEAFQKGEYQCSREMFTKIIKQSGMDADKVKIIEGLYEDSLTDSVKSVYNLDWASIIHIDCDIYTSTKGALQFVEDLIRPGSVIIFDDWHAFDDSDRKGIGEMFGEKRAFNEWPLQNRFDELFDSVHGKVFLMNRDP